MGLDTSIYKIDIISEDEKIYNKLVDEEVKRVEVLYWRKRHDVVEWFSEELDKEIENCESYELSKGVLQDLLKALENNTLEYENYLQTQLREDIVMLKDILKMTDFTKTKYEFYNWW